MVKILEGHEALRDVKDWTAYYTYCQKQAITGVVFGEIERFGDERIEGLSSALLYQWIGEAERIKHQNLQINKELAALCRLDENVIDYAVVKGQVVASYYERPKLRTSGDVDFYCKPAIAEQAKKIICKEWGVEMERGNSAYHYHFEHNGVTFELHFNLFRFYSKLHKDYWQKILHEAMSHHVIVNDTEVITLEPTVHTLYIFLHLYNHLTKVGVGLRQFVDLAMMLKAGVDQENLKHHLQKLGMERAFRACGYVLVEYLGLSNTYFPYRIDDSDRKYGRRMLAVVLYRGNMGHYNKRHGWSGFGHQIESGCIKISHFIKFFGLSPCYHLGWMGERLKLIN